MQPTTASLNELLEALKDGIAFLDLVSEHSMDARHIEAIQRMRHAKAVIVIGHVTGNLSAADRIQVEATGIVDGDVKAPRLVIQEGAMLNGGVEMSSASASAKSSSHAAPPTLAKAAGGL